jgi:hypothetical protein
LLTVDFDNIPEGDEHCTPGNVTKHCMNLVELWESDNLNNISYSESTVNATNEQIYDEIVRINNDAKYDLSPQEQIVVKRDNKYKFITTSDLIVGDQIVSYKDGVVEFITIETFEIVAEETHVFLIYREPWGLIVAESMLAYNGCKISLPPTTDPID